MASDQSSPLRSQAYLDEYNGYQLRSVCIAFMVLDTFFVGLRFLARYFQKAPLGWDDFLIPISLINLLAMGIDSLLALRWAVGYHIERVLKTMPDQIANWGKNSFYAIPILYATAVAWPKLSILLLYLRIFTYKWPRICCWTIAAIIIITAIGNVFGIALQCFPVEKAWNPTLPGHCNNIQAHLIYGSLPNIVTDVAMLLLPIPLVWKLQTSTHVKIGLLATFMVGGAGLITSVIRFAEFFLNQYASDGTWFATPLYIWVIVEASIYHMCACLLTFRPIVVRIIYSPSVSSVYSWLKKRTPYGSTSERSKDRSNKEVKQTASSSFAKGTDSTENLAENSGWYEMEPVPPAGVHVRRDFAVTFSSDMV
ncbi:MAG: hypothetical protein M1820_010696 [Bogoriella megaspora]|nr:MAG: hypothetical protein M1820_010696 [Bogoriella megaspora]